MFRLEEKTIIKASPSEVFDFLTEIDKHYKAWHPQSHVFCQVITGRLREVGSIYHFLEFIGGFPLYLVVQTKKVEKNRRLEVGLVPPFGWLRLGAGVFLIKPLGKNTELTAIVEGGYDNIIWRLLEKLGFFVIKKELILKHMREEGENLQRYLGA